MQPNIRNSQILRWKDWYKTSYHILPYMHFKKVHDEALFLKELSEGKRVVDIYEYYEKDVHSLMVLEYLEVKRGILISFLSGSIREEISFRLLVRATTTSQRRSAKSSRLT